MFGKEFFPLRKTIAPPGIFFGGRRSAYPPEGKKARDSAPSDGGETTTKGLRGNAQWCEFVLPGGYLPTAPNFPSLHASPKNHIET